MSRRAYDRSGGPLDLLEAAAARLLDRGPSGAGLRLAGLALTLILYWFALSLPVDPARVATPAWASGLPFPANVLVNVLASLFAPQVLIHLLPVIGGVWIGLRLGTHYLADLFDLESTAIASRYLRGALFGIDMDTLQVSSGDLKHLDWASPLVRIGGPGYLAVHLGFAAVCETLDGHPRVYGPSRRALLQGFERLRDVVDLRDQMRQVDEMRAVTRDGIEVFARDAQMVFRVYGGGRPRSLEDPYPFTEEAIRRLVYGQAVMAQGLQKWTEALTDLVRREIGAFVGDLTLEALLALQPGSAAVDAAVSPRAESFHIPRRQLTERFHTDDLHRRLQEAGLELAWVGVGTWEVRGLASPAASPPAPRTFAAPAQGFPDLALQTLRELIEAWDSAAADDNSRALALARRVATRLLGLHRVWLAAPTGPFPEDVEAALAHLAGLAPLHSIDGAGA